jgi:hypothetical protein
MTNDERSLLNARIAELTHHAFVTIRNAVYVGNENEEDRREEINNLADLMHNLPRYIVGHDEHAIDSFEQLRVAVVEHVKRFHPKMNPAEHHYVQLLDMDAEEFLRHYRDHQWDEPQSVSSVQ